MLKLNKKKLITVSREEVITEELIKEAIAMHRTLVTEYIENEDMYMSNHQILRMDKKPPWKPDNRLVINYAKYIVDTFGGYHLGNPVKLSHSDNKVDDFIKRFRKQNDMEDTEYELAKLVDIFGHAFLYVYQDEEGLTRVTYNSPINMLIVHDDGIQEKPRFAVRYQYTDNDMNGVGEVLTDDEIINFELRESNVRFGERYSHVYSKLPVIEMILNDERQGVFDSVKTLINALNKAMSEKANDVDYFADAYLKIIGAELAEDVAVNIRDSRIINLWNDGAEAKTLDAGFLDKPNSDTTQENLIRGLKEAIFSISMVANITEEDFGNASGTALAFKLQAMSNLAKVKDRKMQSAFNRLYEVVFSVPMVQVASDGWLDIDYQFTRNVPRNLLEEAQIVSQLDGQVSDETKLKVLSIVDDVKAEIEKAQKEGLEKSQSAFNVAMRPRDTDSEVVADVVENEAKSVHER